MQKYKLFSEQAQVLLSEFYVQSDVISQSELDHIMNYLINRKKTKKSYLITNDDNTVITIIDQHRQTAYLYSNCGIHFDLNYYFRFLVNQNKRFSSILCDDIIYTRFQHHLDPDLILIEKKQSIYHLDINNQIQQKKLELIPSEINSRLFNYLLYNELYKILNEHQILFMYNHFIGIVHVTNTFDFTNAFFEILNDQHEIIINPEQDPLTGCEVEYKDTNQTIEDWIKSIILLKNTYQAYQLVDYQLIEPTQSFKHEIQSLLKALHVKENSILHYESSQTDPSTLLALGFTKVKTNTYLYYYNFDNHILKEIPELRSFISTSPNYKMSILIVLFLPFYFVTPTIINYLIFDFNNLTLAVIISILYFIIGIPLSLLKLYRIYYQQEEIKSCYFKRDIVSYVFFSLCIIIYIISMIPTV